MTYEVYRYLFTGGVILSGVMFVVSILLFIFLRIPRVVGDLSGFNAKKAIENIRKQNESTGNKTFKSSYVNHQRGKITDRISATGSLIKNVSGETAGAMATEKISTDGFMSFPREDETTLLSEISGNETIVLSQLEEVGAIFKIEYDITFIHTNEIIV